MRTCAKSPTWPTSYVSYKSSSRRRGVSSRFSNLELKPRVVLHHLKIKITNTQATEYPTVQVHLLQCDVIPDTKCALCTSCRIAVEETIPSCFRDALLPWIRKIRRTWDDCILVINMYRDSTACFAISEPIWAD